MDKIVDVDRMVAIELLQKNELGDNSKDKLNNFETKRAEKEFEKMENDIRRSFWLSLIRIFPYILP